MASPMVARPASGPRGSHGPPCRRLRSAAWRFRLIWLWLTVPPVMATGSKPSNSHRPPSAWAQAKNCSRVMRGFRRAVLMAGSLARSGLKVTLVHAGRPLSSWTGQLRLDKSGVASGLGAVGPGAGDRHDRGLPPRVASHAAQSTLGTSWRRHRGGWRHDPAYKPGNTLPGRGGSAAVGQ